MVPMASRAAYRPMRKSYRCCFRLKVKWLDAVNVSLQMDEAAN
jgi:hypothetical protein